MRRGQKEGGTDEDEEREVTDRPNDLTQNVSNRKAESFPVLSLLAV